MRRRSQGRDRGEVEITQIAGTSANALKANTKFKNYYYDGRASGELKGGKSQGN